MQNGTAHKHELGNARINTDLSACNDVYVSMQFTMFYPTAIATRGGDFWVTQSPDPLAPYALYFKVEPDETGNH